MRKRKMQQKANQIAPEGFSGVTTRAYTEATPLRLLQPVQVKQTRHAYTTADRRAIKRDYTNGCLSGREMAAQLVPKRSYDSFRQFVHRNPELSKRNQKSDYRISAAVEEC